MLSRIEVLGAIKEVLCSSVVVAPLGNTVRELYGLADAPLNFYLLGSMGMPIPVALGLALGQSRTVIALEGDGGCLMNLGALGTVARYGPANLKIVIFDNGVYESTGGQPSHSQYGTSLVDVARGCGIEHAWEVQDRAEVARLGSWLLKPGPRLVTIKTALADKSFPRVPLAPAEIYRRVQGRLLEPVRLNAPSTPWS